MATANALGKSLYQQSTELIEGAIPHNLIYLRWDLEKPVLTWWTPQQNVNVCYTANLNIPDGQINIPSLVWQWHESSRSLNIYAVKEDMRYGFWGKVELYHAPFHNVYESGDVCIGTGRQHIAKADSFNGLMASVEKVFFNSKASEVHHRGVTGNLNSLHHELVTTGCEFPLDRLISMKRKLNQIL